MNEGYLYQIYSLPLGSQGLISIEVALSPCGTPSTGLPLFLLHSASIFLIGFLRGVFLGVVLGPNLEQSLVISVQNLFCSTLVVCEGEVVCVRQSSQCALQTWQKRLAVGLGTIMSSSRGVAYARRHCQIFPSCSLRKSFRFQGLRWSRCWSYSSMKAGVQCRLSRLNKGMVLSILEEAVEWHVGERVEAVRGKSAVIYCAEDMSVLLMERQGVLSGVAEGTASRDRADSAIIVYMRNIGLYDSKNVFIKEQQLSLDSAPKGAPSAHSYSPWYHTLFVIIWEPTVELR